MVAEAGIERHIVEEILNSDDGLDAKGNKMSERHQVTGVTLFIVNNAITLSGAQAPETFLDAFKQART